MRLYPRIKHLMVTLWLPISLSLGGMACSNAKRDAGHLMKPTTRSRTIKTPPKNNADSAEAPTLPYSGGSSISDSPSITLMSYGDGRPSSTGIGGSSPSSSGPPSGHASSSVLSSASSIDTPAPSGPQNLVEAQTAVDTQAQQALHCGGIFGPCLQKRWKSLQAAIIAAEQHAPHQQAAYQAAAQAAGRVVSCKVELEKKKEDYRKQLGHVRRLSQLVSEEQEQPSGRVSTPPLEGDVQDHRQQYEQAQKEQTEVNHVVLQAEKALKEAKVDALNKLNELFEPTANNAELLREIEEAVKKAQREITVLARQLGRGTERTHHKGGMRKTQRKHG